MSLCCTLAATAQAEQGPLPTASVATGAALGSEHQPMTRSAAKVLREIGRIESRLTRTRYQHRTVVRPWAGVFLWDCSGMADWIIRRVAPRARRAIHRKRPVARDFHRLIARSPTDRARRGWRRVARVTDARPGDVFTWLRPSHWPKGISGHVGFVMSSPKALPGRPGAYAVRIADATSIPHENDSRNYDEGGGFGTGTILFKVDDDGRGTHYGWHGSRGDWTAETEILIGRLYP